MAMLGGRKAEGDSEGRALRDELAGAEQFGEAARVTSLSLSSVLEVKQFPEQTSSRASEWSKNKSRFAQLLLSRGITF